MFNKNLIKSCIKGDRRAQAKLYREHSVFLFGVAMRYAKDKSEAEDILQEGFYRILKDLKNWSQKAPLEAWMRKVMINSALMYLRKYRKMEFEQIMDIENTILEISDLSFEEKERANAVIRMIQSLPDPYQTIFNMKAIDGFSYQEISENLGVNENTLRSLYLRARNKLKIILQKEL